MNISAHDSSGPAQDKFEANWHCSVSSMDFVGIGDIYTKCFILLGDRAKVLEAKVRLVPIEHPLCVHYFSLIIVLWLYRLRRKSYHMYCTV